MLFSAPTRLVLSASDEPESLLLPSHASTDVRSVGIGRLAPGTPKVCPMPGEDPCPDWRGLSLRLSTSHHTPESRLATTCDDGVIADDHALAVSDRVQVAIVPRGNLAVTCRAPPSPDRPRGRSRVEAALPIS